MSVLEVGSSLYTAVKILVLPPGQQAVLGVLGLCCLPRWRRLGFALVAVSIVSLAVLATPTAAAALARLLEVHRPLDPAQVTSHRAEAIVVLGGGSYRNAPEFSGFDDVSRLALERLRYAARLHRVTGLPLAVTGGIAGDISMPEGVSMAVTLVSDFRVPVSWIEARSRNTAENASRSAQAFPFRRIVLVTHAVHMRRVVAAFEDAGFEVLPAPMGFITRRDDGPAVVGDYLPNAKALAQSQYAIYELIGALWYRLTYA